MGYRGAGIKAVALDAAAAVGYGLAFTALWLHSVDQWYLPAGLRFAALMATSPRRWPALFTGEFVALIALRQHLIVPFGMPWLIIASAALFPVTAAVIFVARRSWAREQSPLWHDTARLAASAIAAAILSKLTVLLCLHELALPHAMLAAPERVAGLLTQHQKLPTYVLGDLLGILLLAPATLLIIQRPRLPAWPSLRWYTAWTGPAFGALFMATMSLNGEWKQVACYLMFIPAGALTLTLGWRGSVVGIFAANLGIALGMHNLRAIGASDPTMLAVQTSLAVFSIVFLAVGSALSHHAAVAQDRAADAERASADARRTMELARLSMQRVEHDMHERAKRAAIGHSSWLNISRSMIERLRKIDPAAAMELTYTAALETRTFHGQILESLYPLKLESDGLYSGLRTSAMITALEETGVEVRWRLIGNPGMLSMDLKRMLYRSVIETVDSFAKCEPESVTIVVRCGKVRSRQGGAIILSATGLQHASDEETLALAHLYNRVQIHGGSMRQHRDRVTVLLTERVDERAAWAA